MSLEITSVPPLPKAAPPQGAAPAQGQQGGKANPFASLLADLDAAQQPQISDMTETSVPSTNIFPTMPTALPGDAAPETAVAEIDALKIFMGPAFNSRLAMAQTEDAAKSVVTASPATNTPQVAVNAASTLLNLLAQKTQAPVTDITEAPTTVATVEPAMTVAIAQTENSDDADIEDASTDLDIEYSISALASNQMPAIVLPTPIVAPPEPVSSIPSTNGIGSGEQRISLFDRLSKTTQTETAATTEASAEPTTSDEFANMVAVPDAATDTATPTPVIADSAQAAPAAPPSSTPTIQRDLPQVTMRPINEAQMVEGVSVLLARAGKNQVNDFIIRMDPPELGRIEVQLKMHDDGTVQAVIASDNPNTHDLLRREASTIERALAESGFRTGSDGLSFNLKQQSNDQQRRDPEKYNSSAANTDAATEDNIPSSVFAPLRQRYENARINISA
jgi:flagellar hook-length control protein FliK